MATKGFFHNNVPYAKWGRGHKVFIILSGGPGNAIPSGMAFNMMSKPFRHFINAYTLFLVTRKYNMPEGYTTKQMADDCAEFIKKDFNGQVDIIIGLSYGGLIMQHFSALYPTLAKHHIIAMAAHEGSESGKKTDYKFATLLCKGKKRQAAAKLANALYPFGIKKLYYKIILWFSGPSLFGSDHPYLKNDLMVEARAEYSHEARESLKKIQIPVLILAGEKDIYFPINYYHEMHEMIKNSKLRIYKGLGHAQILESGQFTKDIIEFIRTDKKHK